MPAAIWRHAAADLLNELLMSARAYSHMDPMRQPTSGSDIPRVRVAAVDGRPGRRPRAFPAQPRGFANPPGCRPSLSTHRPEARRRAGGRPLSSRTACTTSYAPGGGMGVNLLATPSEGDHPETVEICFGSTVCMQAAASGRSLSNLRSTAPHISVGAKPAKGEPEWLRAL